MDGSTRTDSPGPRTIVADAGSSSPEHVVFKRIPIDDIQVPEGRRKLRNIEELAASMAEVGLLNPITVTEDYGLVAGYHRLEAARLLG